jgi:AmmeMemoRadiSam system protein A
LAKETVENYTLDGGVIEPPANLPKHYLNKRAGVFVSIHQNGRLRGCIGTYLPTKENIAAEVIANAIDAATCDPRFDCIKKEDLSSLEYEVYVLEKPEPVASINELDPKTLGVIVTGAKTKRSALLLPGLEGISTVEEQLDCACQKAGIEHAGEGLIVQKFRAEKF